MLFNRDKYHTQYRKITRANDFPIFSNKKSEILKNFVCIFLLYYIIIICSILFGNSEPKVISFQEVKNKSLIIAHNVVTAVARNLI